MARYSAVVHTPWPLEEAFDYLSDFSTTQEWDPGVSEASKVRPGPVRTGSEFRLLASFLGRSVPLTYEVVEYDPSQAVTLVGENATVISRDRITLASTAKGTKITYEANLSLKGVLKIADPLLAIAFRRVGDRALAGLRLKLSEPSSTGRESGASAQTPA